MSSAAQEEIEELRKQNRELMSELDRYKGALLNMYETISATRSTTDHAFKILSRFGYPPLSPKVANSLR